MAPLTAETRLYRWLKRKTTPADAWRTLSVKQLAEKARCSTSQVSRTLPRVVAKLNDISLDEAETAVADVMAVRRCRLLDWGNRTLETPPISGATCLVFSLSITVECLRKTDRRHL